MPDSVYAGIDAGGTEFKCIVGRGPDDVLAMEKIPVAEPNVTLAACVAFFQRAVQAFGPLRAMGIGSFGPVDLDVCSPNYGFITSTPKIGWRNTDIVGYFKRSLQLDIVFDTDVNAALLAEQQWGSARGLHSAVYVTVGTGIGAGIMTDGRLLHGAMHAEAGHMLIPRLPNDAFQGSCPFHGACLEGLASGPALAKRWGQDPRTLSDDHSAWSTQAQYLGAMCVNLALCYSPQRIILGGGVMQRAILLPLVRQSYGALMNAYLPPQAEAPEQWVVAAGLGERAGALGALALAQKSE